MNTEPDGDVTAECRTRRMGSVAHAVGSRIQVGLVGDLTSKIAAESAAPTITVGEFGPGWPPKRSIEDESSLERVPHASDGPWEVVASTELLTSCHGGEPAENEEDKER